MPGLRPYVRILAAAASGLAVIARAALVCEAPVFDFGVRPDTDGGLSHTFEIRNDGAEPTMIVAVRSTCDCLTADMAKRTLRPGEQAPIDVHFRFDDRAGGQRRVIHLAFRPEADPSAPLQVLSLTLTGTILPPVLRVPNPVDLGVVLPGHTVTGIVQLMSGRAGPFALGAVGLQDKTGRADYTTGQTATNHTIRLIVQAPDRFGVFSGLALVTTDLAEQPQIPVAYRGHVAPLIEAVPPFIGTARDTPVDVRIALASAHRVPFAALAAQTTDPRLSASLTREESAFQIHVTSKAPGRELADALVRVTTDHPLGRIVEIPVRLIDSP